MFLIDQNDLPPQGAKQSVPQTSNKSSPSKSQQKQSNSKTKLSLDPELSQHPLFYWREDDILSGLVQALESLIRTEPDPKILTTYAGKFQAHIHNITFNGKKIKELSDSHVFGPSLKAACGKHLVEPNLYFRCMDCEKQHDLQSSLCSACFEKSNHDGHRVLQVRLDGEINAVCDCGDSEVFNPEGFCPEHRSAQLSTKELLAKFPSIIFERYQLVVKKAFYGVMSCFEIAQKDLHYQRKGQILTFADQCFNELLGFCEDCYRGINESFLNIMSITLQAKFLNPYNTVWHDCDDLKAEADPTKGNVMNSHNCKCSILGNLFRIGNVFGKSSQFRLEKILFECGKDAEFKLWLALEYSKFVHFLFSRNYDLDQGAGDLGEDNVNSKLITMEGHFFAKEKINLKVLEAGTFKNYMDILKRVIQNSTGPTSSVFFIINAAINPIYLFLTPHLKSSEILIQQSNVIESLLDIAMRFERKFVYGGEITTRIKEHEINPKSITLVMIIEKVLCQVLDSIITTICQYPEAQKLRFTKLFVNNWYIKLLDITAKEVGWMWNGKITFNPTLERVIPSLILNYLNHEVTMEGLSSFLRETLPEVENSKIAGEAVQKVLKTLGAARFVYVNLSKQENSMFTYLSQGSNVFDIDIAAIQLMSVFLKPEELWDTFVTNFFSYDVDLRNFFNKFTIVEFSKDSLNAQKDFLSFLIFIMSDEICLLNLKIRSADIYQKEPHLTTRDLSNIEKLVINLAIGAYSIPYATLKSILTENFVNNRSEIDSIIPLVTTHDEAHNVRFKDDLKGEFDPYVLFKLHHLQHGNPEVVKKKYEKEENFDLVSGKYDETAPDYLKQIQRNVYQSALPAFLSQYIQKFFELSNDNLQSVLKLILFNLQVTNDAVTHQHEKRDSLLENISQNYLGELFTTNLTKIQQDDQYKDCRLCIIKIKALLKTLVPSHFEESAAHEEVQQEKRKEEEQTLKQKALERMKKMKEEFAKKQALFANKNKPEVAEEESPVLEKQKDGETLTCQHCLETLDSQSEDYGLPVYITFTNNFYDTDQEVIFKPQDYSDLSKVSWWPVISSCHHYFHKKCYKEIHKQTLDRKISNQEQNNYFLSDFETHCSLCKTLCNNFVCVNNSKNSGFLDNLPEEMTLLLLDLKGRLMKSSNLSIDEVSSEEVFRRAYEYFIEAFHLYEKPKALKKSFELYSYFLRSLSCSLTERKRLDFMESSLLRQISQKFKTEPNPAFLLQYQPESLLDRELFKILTLDRASETHNDQLIRSHMTSLLEEYLTFKIIQLLATEKTDIIAKIPDCIAYFQSNISSFQERVCSELAFPLKKIILSWCLNLATSLDLSFANSALFELLCNPKCDLQDLSDLFGQSGITSSFEEMVSKALLHHSIDPASEVLLNSVLNTKSLGLVPSVIKARKLAPHMVKLPETYQDYVTKYMKAKCTFCNQLETFLGIGVCLICNQAVCFMACNKHGERGNWNSHAAQYHMGYAYVMDKNELGRLVINAPGNSVVNNSDSPYIDNLGQSILTMLSNPFTVHKVEFKKFVLNPSVIEEIKDTINNQSIGDLCYRSSLATNGPFGNGVW